MLPYICAASSPHVPNFNLFRYTVRGFIVTGHFETNALNKLSMVGLKICCGRQTLSRLSRLIYRFLLHGDTALVTVVGSSSAIKGLPSNFLFSAVMGRHTTSVSAWHPRTQSRFPTYDHTCLPRHVLPLHSVRRPLLSLGQGCQLQTEPQASTNTPRRSHGLALPLASRLPTGSAVLQHLPSICSVPCLPVSCVSCLMWDPARHFVHTSEYHTKQLCVYAL